MTNALPSTDKRHARRRYENDAARAKTYRARVAAKEETFRAFRAELLNAFSYGRAPKLLEHGPEEPTAWLLWATERLQQVRLVPYPRAAGEGRRLSKAAREALEALAAGRAAEGCPRQTWKMLCERGWVADGRITEQGREALER